MSRDCEMDELARLKALAKLSEQCISVFDVDLRTGLYTIVKHPETTTVMDRADRRWDLALGRDFAAECLGDTQEVIRNVGSVDFLRRELDGVKYREYIYAHRVKVDEGVHRRCEVVATERDGNGVAVRALVDFIVIDDAAAERRTQAEYLSVVTKALYGYNLMVNLETLKYTVIIGTGMDAVSEVYNSTDDYRTAFATKIRFIAPNDREKLTKLLSPAALKQYAAEGVRGAVGGTVIYEAIVGGKRQWHETNVFISMNVAGEPVANILGRNVTERVRQRQEEDRRLKEALRAAEKANRRNEVLHKITKSAPWSVRFDEMREIVRTEYSKALKEEVIGNDFDDNEGWIGLIHPEDRERAVRESLAAMRDETGETVFDSEYRIRRRSGEYHWIRSSGRVILDLDGGGEMYGICMDIDESVRRREARQRELETALEEVREAHTRGEMIVDALKSAQWLFRLSADDRIVGWEYSRDIGRIVKNAKASESYEWSELVHPDDREPTRRAFYATLKDRTGKTPYDVTFRMVDDTGRYNWFRSVGNAFRREDGTGEFYGIHIDVTARVENQMALERAAAQAKIDAAEETSRAKTMFLANMSHDIRTPMNAIIGFTDIARKHVDDPQKVNAYLDKVQLAGSNLLEIINDILDMSKIDSEKVEITEYPAWISRMPRYFRTILSTRMAKHRHAFVCECGACRDETVWIDKPHMNRIVVNLLTNAMKYTPDGGRILFRVEQLPDRGGFIETALPDRGGFIETALPDRGGFIETALPDRGGFIETALPSSGRARVDDAAGYATFRIIVQDNGMGMSEEFQKCLFERFTREKSSTMSGIQGTGIGMAIVKSLTEAMGGTIEVESKEGEGTKFTLTFDFRRRRPGEGELPEEELEKGAALGVESGLAKRILLVEDNEINREIALEILKGQHFEVDTAVNGKEAVEKATSVSYDLILMDIMMPVMNGLDAARAIRAWEVEKLRSCEVEKLRSGISQTPVPSVALAKEGQPLTLTTSQLLNTSTSQRCHVPIIALSANAFTEDREASLAAGMNEHLSKPIKVRELLDCIAKFGDAR